MSFSGITTDADAMLAGPLNPAPLRQAQRRCWPAKKYRYVLVLERWEGGKRDDDFDLAAVEVSTPAWSAFHHACHTLGDPPEAVLADILHEGISECIDTAEAEIEAANGEQSALVRSLIEAGVYFAVQRAARRAGNPSRISRAASRQEPFNKAEGLSNAPSLPGRTARKAGGEVSPADEPGRRSPAVRRRSRCPQGGDN